MFLKSIGDQNSDNAAVTEKHGLWGYFSFPFFFFVVLPSMFESWVDACRLKILSEMPVFFTGLSKESKTADFL